MWRPTARLLVPLRDLICLGLGVWGVVHEELAATPDLGRLGFFGLLMVALALWRRGGSLGRIPNRRPRRHRRSPPRLPRHLLVGVADVSHPHRVLTPTGAFRAWWSVVMLLLVAILIAVFSIGYTAYEQRQSDQRWCPLLSIVDQPNRPPAQTPEAAQGRLELHRLRHDLGCKGA